jgi:origin recognition complex subunit 1
MRCRTEAGDLPHFQFVQINGLLLPSPQHAYSTLYEALTGERLGPANAAAALEEMFAADGGGAARGRARARSRRPTIVLLDEMDLLVNRTQTVLYNMFDWPSRRGSRLSIIGIANTMDLPERLHPRIGSRLAGRRVVFHPYRREQLETIVRSRLEGFPVFDANAVLLAARKVANCSGDVRRCLELCRRAAEIAQEVQQGAEETAEVTQRVTVSHVDLLILRIGALSAPQLPKKLCVLTACLLSRGPQLKHVDAAIREAFNTLHVKIMEASSRLERLVLAALHLESRFTGRPEALLEAVADRLDQLCMANNEPRYSFSAVLQCTVGLGAARLLLCDPGHKRLKAKVALNVPVNDLLYVLTKDNAELPWLAERLK